MLLAGTWRKNNAIITSKRRNNDIIIVSRVRWDNEMVVLNGTLDSYLDQISLVLLLGA